MCTRPGQARGWGRGNINQICGHCGHHAGGHRLCVMWGRWKAMVCFYIIGLTEPSRVVPVQAMLNTHTLKNSHVYSLCSCYQNFMYNAVTVSTNILTCYHNSSKPDQTKSTTVDVATGRGPQELLSRHKSMAGGGAGWSSGHEFRRAAQADRSHGLHVCYVSTRNGMSLHTQGLDIFKDIDKL